jgi:tryptophan 7-halogenase
MSVPDTLRHKIDLFGANGRFFRQNDELFNETSWAQVMLGQGIRPQGYHPLVDNTDDAPIYQMLANVKAVMHAVVDRMPTHEQAIARHCQAPRA